MYTFLHTAAVKLYVRQNLYWNEDIKTPLTHANCRPVLSSCPLSWRGKRTNRGQTLMGPAPMAGYCFPMFLSTSYPRQGLLEAMLPLSRRRIESCKNANIAWKFSSRILIKLAWSHGLAIDSNVKKLWQWLLSSSSSATTDCH